MSTAAERDLIEAETLESAARDLREGYHADSYLRFGLEHAARRLLEMARVKRIHAKERAHAQAGI